MNKKNRRTFIKNGLIGGALGLFPGFLYANRATPKEVEGPFYPVFVQKDKDFDLTKIEGKDGIAKGTIIVIEGQVLDTENNPVESATIELWQANSAGRYRHPHDSSKVPLDPNFQGWAIVQSGKKGVYRFKTVYPGTYPVSETWIRPPHIHFKISKKSYIEFTTQMYFPGHKLNKSDRLLMRKRKEERKFMIATKIQETPETYKFNIVLQKA